jgi:hypothetical protein
MSFPDDWEDAPLSDEDKQELRGILLHQLTVLKTALHRVKELRHGAVPGQPIEGDEPVNKEP